MPIWIWKEKSATLSFCLLTFKLTAFFFSLPSSVSWCLSPAKKKNSHSHTEFQELFCHFHHHCTLLFIPMKATSHLASSAHRNFDTRLLSRKNSEVACCRRFRFSLIKNVWSRCLTQRGCQSFQRFSSVKLQSVTQTSCLKVMKGSSFP